MASLIITWRVPWNPTTIITWFVDEKWISIICFLIGYISSILFVAYLSKRKQRQNVLDIKSGGVDLDYCIQPDKVYEIVDSKLANAVRVMLGKTKGLLVVEPAVAIIASFLANKFKFQIANLGFNIIINNAQSVTINGSSHWLAGALSGTTMYWILQMLLKTSIAMTSVLSIGVGLSAFFGVNLLVKSNECKQLVEEVPQALIYLRDNKPVSIPTLDFGTNLDPTRTFINGQLPSQKAIYKKEQQLFNCESPQKVNSLLHRSSPEMRLDPMIKRRCRTELNYVPLSQRTRTIADLKNYDDTSLRNEAKPSIDRYDRKAKEFQARRLRIMENRNQHNDNEF
ncbi:hypothetical protein IV203_000072 (plastid) [Nitzschia inconspicua]|uniref:Uncharacterized protein n=1 Tax=Nitzschia inconspicua TaxID=303405 RepID=A0A8H2SI90_9STRA|nr:hypothetical protein IV203_000072 [Nitzschia inconspicua]